VTVSKGSFSDCLSARATTDKKTRKDNKVNELYIILCGHVFINLDTACISSFLQIYEYHRR
jgi:hypothetical protein